MEVVRSSIAFVFEMFSDDGIFLLLNTYCRWSLMYNSHRTNYIIIHTQRIVERFVSLTFNSCEISRLAKTDFNTRSIFFPRSLSSVWGRIRRISGLWKARWLDQGCRLTGFRLVWSWKARYLLKVESISFSGYFTFRNIVFRSWHSIENEDCREY